jgi:hypothetical protein
MEAGVSYTPFKKMEAKLAHRPGVTNPAGLAAAIARSKYGNKAVQQAAASGSSLRGHKVIRHGKRHKMLSQFAKRHG